MRKNPNFNPFPAVAAIALIAALAPAKAHANVAWTLSGVTFADGGSASGTFVTSDTGYIQSWDITTSGGTIAETYDSSSGSVLNGSATYSFNLQSDDTTTTMILLGQNDLLAANSPDLVLHNSFEQVGANPERLVTAGDFVLSDVPEPASMAVLGTGLACLALGRYRRRRST